MIEKKIVIVGQGYVGLPVAVQAARKGFNVVGIEIDSIKVDSLNSKTSYVDDVSDLDLQEIMDSGHYSASSDYSDAEGFEFAVITVPTPLKETLPDLSYIEQAGEALAPYITKGATVILESTTYPGTTENLLVPILEEFSGLSLGKDFYVGYSPERIDPGNSKWGFVNTPKVVSGIGTESLSKVQWFYDQLVEKTIAVSGSKEAELTKLLENTFRHVNIALVNELAIFANQLGVDIWEAIEAANTKPFGYLKFTPGPGVGGHCLPVDPSYLSWQVRRELGTQFRFIELANEVNDHQPHYVIQRIIERLNRNRKSLNGSTILVVGVAYKPNTADLRESPALKIIDLLNSYGARVLAADGHVPDFAWPVGAERVNFRNLDEHNIDLAIIITPHSDFDLEQLASVPVFDTRNVLTGPNVEKL